jgi:hypothetical protein
MTTTNPTTNRPEEVTEMTNTYTDSESTVVTRDLMELILDEGVPYFGDHVAAWSYEEAEILTNDDGFVLRTEQGEFQVTVVQSDF